MSSMRSSIRLEPARNKCPDVNEVWFSVFTNIDTSRKCDMISFDIWHFNVLNSYYGQGNIEGKVDQIRRGKVVTNVKKEFGEM